MKWIAHLYARRIVNVNVNIVLAGLLALPPVVLMVHLLGRLHFKPDHMIGIGPVHLYTASAVTLVADVVFDFSIYLGLHWLANHHPWRNKFLAPADLLLGPAEKLLEPAHKGLSFIHDAGLVQFERAVLSPLLYAVWIGLQSVLINRDMSPEWATAIGCLCGIAVARTLHTFWMLYHEGQAKRARAAKTPPPPPPAANPTRPAATTQSAPKRTSIVR